jgi:diguanylate cyclase (GGDEF)-like protein/PAS domain S-box-containing protein
VTYVQASRLKVTGAVCYRLSNPPTTGLRAVCGGAPQAFFPGLVRGVALIPPEAKHEQNDAYEVDYKFLVENCADILCSVGADQVIHYVSPSSLHILGWKPEEMTGKNFGDFVFPGDISVLDEAEAADVNGGAADSQATVRLIKKDLTAVWTNISARCVRDPATGNPQECVLAMRDVTERKVLEEKLSSLAMTDGLTGLWNRRAFDQNLRREWKRTVREKSQLSLLLLDIDHFKPFNDRHGHPVGDACLCAVASAISDTVRASDVVCRWGGDEMAIILPATDGLGALGVAEKVRSAIQVLRFRPNKNSGDWASVTISIGVATAMPQPDGTITAPQDLLLTADKALYKAKHDGQNRVATALSAAPATQAAGVKPACKEPKYIQGMGGSTKGPPDGTDGL